ncbi:MAG: hypothetical protein CK427_02145 [Leptospira sp.]|nr:MAG: hypothetical protein CK427_02145 [Leptospira sp.]
MLAAKKNDDDENVFLVAALLLVSGACNFNVFVGSTSLSLPFFTAYNTVQNVSFITAITNPASFAKTSITLAEDVFIVTFTF